MTATLNEKIRRMHELMDKVTVEMADENMPVILIAYTGTVLRAAYEMTLRAQHTNTPIADIDEAIVATVSSMLFDYLQRIHPQNKRTEVVNHLKLIGQDVTERVMHQIDAHFVPEIILPTKH